MHEVVRKRDRSKLSSVLPTGILEMITLKLIALVLGAGMLLSVFSADFSADLVLAIVTCFS